MRKPRARALRTLSACMILASCSARDPVDNAPAYSFRLGSQTIFALNQWNELMESPSPLSKSLEKAFPKLTFSAQNRILAELGTSDGTVIPAVNAGPFSAEPNSCALDPVLIKTRAALSRIALTKDIHSQVESNFSTLSNCATKRALECFLAEINARNWTDLPTAAARGLTLKGIVARLGTCTGSETPWQTKPHFTIANNTIYFYPSPVLAVYIFAGEHKSYNETVPTKDTHMKALGGLCQENCFDTPLSLGRLAPSVTGNKLESGQIYTAFLQLTPSQTDESMVPVVFTAP